MKVSICRKIGLFILFGAAIFIMIAACLRVYFVAAVCNPLTRRTSSPINPPLTCCS